MLRRSPSPPSVPAGASLKRHPDVRSSPSPSPETPLAQQTELHTRHVANGGGDDDPQLRLADLSPHDRLVYEDEEQLHERSAFISRGTVGQRDVRISLFYPPSPESLHQEMQCYTHSPRKALKLVLALIVLLGVLWWVEMEWALVAPRWCREGHALSKGIAAGAVAPESAEVLTAVNLLAGMAREFAHPPPTFHALTYASDARGDFCTMLSTATAHGLPVTLLGWGGGTDKLAKLSTSLLYVSQIPWYDIVLFFDGFDVLISAGVQEFVEKFERISHQGADIVFGAEKGCFPWGEDTRGPWCWDIFPDPPLTRFGRVSPYRTLNSGSWIARAGAIKALLQDVIDMVTRLQMNPSTIRDQEVR
jgi:hypothetical protein